MKLPIPFLNTKNDDSSYYLALLITDEKACGVILFESAGRVKIINTHQEFFTESVEHLSQEELITAVDKTISKAEEVLPPNIETHKTIFGVKEGWVDEETKKIKKDYLSRLKKVCDSLDLTPIGFMVTTEAIANLLQQEEGAPLSAVFAELGPKSVTLTLFRAGKPIEKVQGPRGESAATSVDKLLQHFTIAVLPARIILFSSKHNDHLSQQFIAHQWSKSIPFLHMPQVTMLPAGFDAKAVTFGAATQLGFELVNLSNQIEPHTLPVHPKLTADDNGEEEEPQHAKHSEEEPEDEERKEAPHSLQKEEDEIPTPMSGDNFGFVAGQDVASSPAHTKESLHHKQSLHETPVHHAEHTAPHPHQAHESTHHEPVIRHALHTEDDRPRHEESTSKKKSLLSALPAISMPKFNLGSSQLAKNKLLWIIIGVILFLIIAGVATGYYYYSNVTASVKLTLRPEVATETDTVTFSATSPSDFSKHIVAAKNVTTTVNGELSINTTGKKDTGEKAKGQVTIYNNSDDPERLSSGAIIKASNGQQFVIDKDVSVSSASGDIFSGTKPGTADVSVTAKEFGSEYNMPSNTKFSIGGNNLLAAKNDSAFSGGSKKTITVVSKEDMAKLRVELPQTLEDKAMSELSKAADSGETVLPVVLSTRLTKEKFDKKLDDEAKKLKLTATIQFAGLAYADEDLEQYTKSLLKGDNSANVNIADNSVKNTVEDAKKKNEKEVEATVNLEAGLLPVINKEEITRDLDGKSLSEAQAILERLPQLESSEITFSPNIPLLPNVFPSLPKNITVDITAHE